MSYELGLVNGILLATWIQGNSYGMNAKLEFY